jgi:hypothetical protein
MDAADPDRGSSSVSGFNTRYTRMSSLWAKIFALIKRHLRWMVQWIAIIVCVGLQWTPWPRLLVNESAEIRNLYELMTGTLDTCSSWTCVAAIPFCVYQIWVTDKLFKQICILLCWIVYTYLGSSVHQKTVFSNWHSNITDYSRHLNHLPDNLPSDDQP